MRRHLAIGIFLVSAFALLFWQLKSTVGDKSLTSSAFATTIATCPDTNKNGDANCDAKIDGADYELWRKKYTGGDIGTANVDFDQDGKVDMKDFEIWRRGKLGLSITTVPSPTTNPNVGSCMCDLGAVVENSCAAGATAACTGKFSCACQTAPSPTSGGGYITLTPSPYPSGFDPYCPKSGRKVWYRVGYVCEHYECQFGTCVGVKTSPAEDQPDSCTSPGIACGGYGYNGGGTQPQPTATTAPAPTSTAQVPACSACGSLYAAKPGSLCSQVSCIGTESCVEVQATCTVNGVSNPNCYRAQCARTGDL